VTFLPPLLSRAARVLLGGALFLSLASAQSPGDASDTGRVTLSPGAFVGFAGGMALSRPPYPDTWEPNPLRFPYEAEDTVYLPPDPPPLASVPEPSARPAMRPGVFSLPPGVDETVRVLLQDETRSLLINARGGADVQWRRIGGQIVRGPAQNGPVRVERRNGRFVIAPVRGDPVSGASAVSLRLASLDPASPLEVNGKAYRGTLEFHISGSGFICVNVLPVEEYLRGVVPLEMGRHDESKLEALKAQAVTARTYALKRMLARVGADYDLLSSVQDQVYGGAAAEHAMSDRAIRETAGMVLSYRDSLAQCYYHSTCGGHTASRHEVWGGPQVPYLISGPDTDAQGRAWCAASRYMNWTQSWDADALAVILRRNISAANGRGPASFQKITGARVRERFSDGRIQLLEIATDRGRVELRGDKTRFALRPGSGSGRILESARFEISTQGNHIVASGSGFGHGIGMCQMGAQGRALAGQGYAEILEAYYPGTSLAKLTPAR
jgi:SpoIID/LytB domain protein